MIRLGLIGAGKNGQGHLKAFSAFPDRCRISAVADTYEAGAQAVAAEYGARAFSDYTEFFDLVDAVIISTPHFLHPENTIRSAEAGKHCFIEKPVALSVAECDAMLAAVDAAGVKTLTSYTVRFDPTTRTLVEAARSGRIGSIVSASSRRFHYLKGAFEEDSWRTDTNQTGGILTEIATHEIDWIVDLLGWPRAVSGRKYCARQSGFLANDHIWIDLHYEGGVTATIESSQLVNAGMTKQILGDDGHVALDGWGKPPRGQFGREEAASDLEPLERFSKHAHFLDVVEGRAESVADIHYSRKITMICEKVLQSAESGETVAFSETAS